MRSESGAASAIGQIASTSSARKQNAVAGFATPGAVNTSTATTTSSPSQVAAATMCGKQQELAPLGGEL